MRLFLAKKEHLDQVFRGRMPPIPTIEVSDIADLAPGQVAIGYPTRNHGPIAPVLLVSRDNEIQDILAWVTTYLPDIRPLTSSCRAVTLSDWVKLTGAAIPQNKSPVASPWSGLVLGECYAQARGRTNLRRIPLAGALSCLSFTDARLTHLWSSAPHFDKLVERVVENHRRLLPRRLTFDSATLLPIWSSLWRSRESNHLLAKTLVRTPT